ncbi:hypothetical protein N7454_010495 [Penicillium verhagenii]|nr:hypothetical protein N7454_010495 [Penicillium verhagenii]
MASPVRGPTEKHQNPRRVSSQIKDKHPAHRGGHGHNATHDMRSQQPKPPKPGCPFHQIPNPPAAPLSTHPANIPHIASPGARDNTSYVYHGTCNNLTQPRTRHQTNPPSPMQQNQPHHHHHHHHHHQAPNTVPTESQTHHADAHHHTHVTQDAAHHRVAPPEREEARPSNRSNPPDHDKRRAHIREEDLMWGYGPPLPILAICHGRNTPRRRRV